MATVAVDARRLRAAQIADPRLLHADVQPLSHRAARRIVEGRVPHAMADQPVVIAAGRAAAVVAILFVL